jgi:1-acyl-sn-glycerol-3-phosphate acyltransferase
MAVSIFADRQLLPQLSWKRNLSDWISALSGMSRHLLAAWRGSFLIASLHFCALRFLWLSLGQLLSGSRITPLQRAEWMHFCGRIVLAAMGIRYRVEGTPPSGSTLIAANHLSYLDIVIVSAALPAAFVAKQEIGNWPFFGPLSKMGGAIFVDRTSRASAWETAEEMTLRLAANVPVVLFPEGTSTDGSDVQRFHSTLFAPAVEAKVPVIPAAVFYEMKGAGTERDLCWFGDDAFLPHLLRVLHVEGFTAVVRFGTPEIYPDRQTAAWRSHDAVADMRSHKS